MSATNKKKRKTKKRRTKKRRTSKRKTKKRGAKTHISLHVQPRDNHYHPLKLLFPFNRIMNPVMARDGYQNINSLFHVLGGDGNSGQKRIGSLTFGAVTA